MQSIYLKVIHLNYRVKHKVDVTIAVLNAVIARLNLRDYYFIDYVDLVRQEEDTDTDDEIVV